jgi:hypothetical protein
VFAGLPAAALASGWRCWRAGQHRLGIYSAGTAVTMLTTVALAGAGFAQSPRLNGLGGLFQRASIITGFGLPPRVESGGVGAGTILRYKLTAGGRTREYWTKIAEPEPGRVLTESDTGSSAVTTFTVSPQGPASLVQISGTWDGAGGIGGLFERMFAPRVLRAIYTDELKRLDAYACERRPA